MIIIAINSAKRHKSFMIVLKLMIGAYHTKTFIGGRINAGSWFKQLNRKDTMRNKIIKKIENLNTDKFPKNKMMSHISHKRIITQN